MSYNPNQGPQGPYVTPEQMRADTQVVSVGQIQELDRQPQLIDSTEHLLLKGAYEAADRRANAVKEQLGKENEIAVTGIGKTFESAGIIEGKNRVVSGRLRGTRPGGEPMFETEAAYQAHQGPKRVAQQAPQVQQAYGPRPSMSAVVAPKPVVRPQREKPVPAAEQFDPHRDDMLRAHQADRDAAAARAQQQNQQSAASRLNQEAPQQQPTAEIKQKPRNVTFDDDEFFDNPLGNSGRPK